MPDPDPAGPATLPPLRAAPASAPARIGPLRAHALLLLEAGCRLLRRPLPSVRHDAALGGGTRFPLHKGSFAGILVPLVVLSFFVDVPVSNLLLPSMVAPADRLPLHPLIIGSYAWTLAWALGVRSAVRHVDHRLQPGELLLAVGFATRCRIPLAAVRDVQVLAGRDWQHRLGLRRAEVACVASLDEPNLLIELDPAHAPRSWTRAGRERPLPARVATYVDQPAVLRQALLAAIASAADA